MIKEIEVEVKGHRTNLEHFTKLGYQIAIRKAILVKVKDLMPGSTASITAICQNCKIEKKFEYRFYLDYTTGFTENYFCKSCSSIKAKETSLKKWGVENPMQSEEVKSKMKSSMLEIYGVEHYSQTEEWKAKFKTGRISVKRKSVVRERLESMKIEETNMVSNNLLSEMQSFLNQFGISYEVKNKKILSGKELDIFIPDFNLAIEMNGLYWHSEIYLHKNYHREKTLKCRELGIDLLHIWEDDWKFKRQIIKSIISNKLGKQERKIFARKCKICEVKSSEAINFLEENHIQGGSPSSFKIGLYFEEELVSLMTFGYRFTNGKKEFELIRFCNKIGLTVIGSASKLFNHFLNNNQVVDKIVSYSDISLFTGNIYQKLGFNKEALSAPNYYWVVNGVRKHRFNFNKQRLIKLGYDAEKSESQILHESGYFRIYSTGQERWIFNRKT